MFSTTTAFLSKEEKPSILAVDFFGKYENVALLNIESRKATGAARQFSGN